VKKFPGNVIQSVYTTQKAVSIRIGNAIGDNDDKGSKNNVLDLVYGNAVARIERDLEKFLKRDVVDFNNGAIR